MSRICALRLGAVLLVSLVGGALSASAQVVIRERVEVDPAVPVSSDASVDAASTALAAPWVFDEAGDLSVRFATTVNHCGAPISSLSPTLEFRFTGSRDTVVTVPVDTLITGETSSSVWFCEWWDSQVQGVIELGTVEAGDTVTPIYYVHGSTAPVQDRYWLAVPTDARAEDDGSYSWSTRNYVSLGDTYGHTYEDLSYRGQFNAQASSPAIEVDRDTILVTEAAVVTLSGVEGDDTPVTLTAESPHGRLVRVVGTDTTAITGPLPYAEIAASEVLFVADGNWPATDAAVAITGTVGGTELEGASLSVLAPALAVELDVDPATYLPVKDDTLTATVRLAHVPEGLRPGVEVELAQDYEFSFLDGTSGARVVPFVRDATGRDSARVQLLSKTWWGVATLQATVQGWSSADTLAAEVQVPIDTDGDTIADSWELDSAHGATLSLGGSPADGAWNEESSPGSPNNGDAFTKLQEYQGVLIGADHLRLDPMSKEVFFDIRNAQAGAFVVAEVRSQLGLVAHVVEGVKNVANPKLSVLMGGPRALEHIAPSIVGSGRVSVGVVFVTDGGAMSSTLNGLVVQNGVYSPMDPRAVAAGGGYAVQYGVTVGSAAGTGGANGAISRIFVGTIDNVWNNNSIPEANTDTFPMTVPISASPGVATWDARYNGTDLNGVNGNGDQLNPFDLASAGSTNNAEDGVVATFLQPRFVEANSLHEVGHALGMSVAAPGFPGGKHPTSGSSVMREGPGPARTTTFSPSDVQEMDLK